MVVDLLHRTLASVTVSSRVENATDAPEHLVDRRAETAWNSKSGDLTPSITVHVPARAWVRRFELTVGYDRVTPRGDQFVKNHRVAKVAVERGGEVVGVFELDPNERKPQSIPIDRQGGTFILRVLETRAGTEPRFREVTLSELAVLGLAPDEVLAPDAMPHVAVEGAAGNRGTFATWFDDAPYASLDEMCRRHTAISAPQIAAAQAAEPNDHFVMELRPGCSIDAAVPAVTLPAPYEIRVLNGMEDVAWIERVVVRTERGWFPTDVVLDTSPLGPGCGQAGMELLEGATVEPRTAILSFDYVKRRAEWLRLDTGAWEAATRTRVACRADARGVACRSATIAATTEDLGWHNASIETGVWNAVPERWQWTRGAKLEADGSFRLGPCVDEQGGHVKCDPSAERWLLR